MLLTGQIGLGFLVIAGMSLYPPASGRILLVPLLNRDSDAAARVALAANAMLLGRGPLPGSWVVVGERRRISAHLRGGDMLLIAAPPAGCGADNQVATA